MSGKKPKTKFSYCSQVCLLMLSQSLHLFSLNEIVDVSKIYDLRGRALASAWGASDTRQIGNRRCRAARCRCQGDTFPSPHCLSMFSSPSLQECVTVP